MKKNWELEDLIEHFTLLPQEMRLVGNKTGETRLGFAVLLKFFQYKARFPYAKNEVPREVINYIAKQLNLSADLYKEYDWNGRSIKYHRAQIREFVGFRECTLDDIKQVQDWLRQEVLTHDLERVGERESI